jgi:putative NADH-flavin reductase
MKILVFGATGRVGNSIALKALDKGYQVVAFIRNKNKLTIKNEYLSVVEGDIYDKDALDKLRQIDFDILINVIGADPLKPSTIFSDATKLILELLSGKPNKRYLAITGIAQMDKTFFGKIAIGILKLTPVKNAIADHQNAFDQISKSTINWTLIGCPYIKDGIEKGSFKMDSMFKGGFKTIHPGDVATAIVQEIDKANDYHKIIGIWY